MMSDYSIDIFDSPEAVSGDWPRGGAEGAYRCHPFQTVAFLETWQASYGRASAARLCLVEVRDRAGRPVMMVPLMIGRIEGCRVLSFADFDFSDYNAPVLFPTDAVWDRPTALALWNDITAQLPEFDLLLLGKMPRHVGELVNPLYFLADEPNPESCHLTRLDRPWAETEKVVQGATNWRRRHRALQRLGTCELLIARTDKERQTILSKLLEQKQRRFEETQVPGFETHPEKRDFLVIGTEKLLAADALHMSALVVNGEIIATYWSLVQGRHYYGSFPTFEAGEWAKYYPGRVLHYLLLQYLSEQGYDCLDLGIGNEPWKLAVCDVTVPLVRLRRARTLRGRIALTGLRLREKVVGTRFWQKLRPLKWIMLRALP